MRMVRLIPHTSSERSAEEAISNKVTTPEASTKSFTTPTILLELEKLEMIAELMT